MENKDLSRRAKVILVTFASSIAVFLLLANTHVAGRIVERMMLVVGLNPMEQAGVERFSLYFILLFFVLIFLVLLFVFNQFVFRKK